MTLQNDEKTPKDAAQIAQSFACIALEYHRQGRLFESISMFEYAGANCAEAFLSYNLGTVLDEAGRLEDAVSAFKKCLELDPNFVSAYNNLGVSLSRLGRKREARSAFRQVVSLTRDQPCEAFHRSAAFFNLGKVHRAAQVFVQAVESNPAKASGFTELYAALARETNIGQKLSRRGLIGKPAHTSTAGNRTRFFRWSLVEVEPFVWLKDAWSSVTSLRKPRYAYLGAGLLTASALSPVLALIPQTNAFKRVVESVHGQNYQPPSVPVQSAPSVPSPNTDYRLAPLAPIESERLRPQEEGVSDFVPPAPPPIPRGPRIAETQTPEQPIERSQATDVIDDFAQELPSSSDHNIKFGNLGLDVGAYTRLTFDDNITASYSNRKADFISTLGLTLGTTWDISRFLSLQFNLGASYSWHFNNSELSKFSNSIALSGAGGDDTELALNFKAGDVKFKIYDKIAYSVSPVDVRAAPGTNTEVNTSARFVNRVGAVASYQLKQTNVTAGVERQDTLPIQSRFKFTRSTTYNFPLGISYDLAKNKKLGVNSSYSITEFNGDTNGFSNNDSHAYSVSPFLSWQPTSNLSVDASVGYSQILSKDNGSNIDDSDDGTVIARLGLTHKVNRVFDHGLDYSRSLSVGQVSNSTQIDDVGYNFNWQFVPDTTLKGRLNYQHVSDSGAAAAALDREEFDRYSASLGVGYQLTKNTSMDLSYSHTYKDSNLSERNYNQNRVTFGVNYDF